MIHIIGTLAYSVRIAGVRAACATAAACRCR
ncbi:DUF2837 family protein [Duganella vulcania]|uniref:DUF2837 family protein n=1 Tax=Duganella vulcania TaxID=2692166 RepID=A0A845GYI8_9BURK|nr:DUF2837 family protein [Duganella vulcania]